MISFLHNWLFWKIVSLLTKQLLSRIHMFNKKTTSSYFIILTLPWLSMPGARSQSLKKYLPTVTTLLHLIPSNQWAGSSEQKVVFQTVSDHVNTQVPFTNAFCHFTLLKSTVIWTFYFEFIIENCWNCYTFLDTWSLLHCILMLNIKYHQTYVDSY